MTFHIIWHSFIILLDIVYIWLWILTCEIQTCETHYLSAIAFSVCEWILEMLGKRLQEIVLVYVCVVCARSLTGELFVWKGSNTILSKSEASAAYGVHKVYGVYCLCVLASCWSLEQVLSVWLALEEAMAWRNGKASVMPWLGFAKRHSALWLIAVVCKLHDL